MLSEEEIDALLYSVDSSWSERRLRDKYVSLAETYDLYQQAKKEAEELTKPLRDQIKELELQIEKQTEEYNRHTKEQYDILLSLYQEE